MDTTYISSKTLKVCERSTGQAPWYLGQPKGRVQAALAPCLPALGAQYTFE